MNDKALGQPSKSGTEVTGEVLSSSDLVLVVDADNTLWDTNEVFARAQVRLLDLTELAVGHVRQPEGRLEFVRAYDQAIAAKHHLHLKYPARLLVFALVAGLSGTDADAAAESVVRGSAPHGALSERQVDDILVAYGQVLSATPQLLPTVREALDFTKSLGLQVYVMTEGKIDRQRRALTEHGLDGLISNVWEMPKAKAQFERLRQRFTPADIVVIGDQVDRDIIPAREAGCTAILVPGNFKPRWDNQPHVADHVAPSLLSAFEWVVSKMPSTPTSKP